jgi:hypothetical protein
MVVTESVRAVTVRLRYFAGQHDGIAADTDRPAIPDTGG